MTTGKFIVFEGVEGCGKSTQVNRIAAWLKQWWPCPVVTTFEPGGTELGRSLRQILLTDREPIAPHAELMLYAADRAQHIETLIKPKLAAGAIVLCDRYTDSTIAYQGYGRGLSLEFIAEINQLATGGLTSDLTLWLDLDVEAGLARVKKRCTPDRIERCRIEFHRRIEAGYQALSKTNPQRIYRIDAGLPVDAVTVQIQQVLGRLFK